MAQTGSREGSTRGTIACLLAGDFEDSEFRIPVDRLRAAGYAVEVIGTRAGEMLRGKKGKESAVADLGIEDADVNEYEGLLIPGGYSPDHLRADQRFLEFVRAFDATRRPLAAVCHGPQLLLSAELQRGRTLTAWKTVQDDLRQAGATVRDQQVVVDGNWITSRQPDDLEAFSAKLIEELGELEGRGQWHATSGAAPPAP
ncbi:MAG TPA: type 1 glutamine amidotransferase domain-containing protein [Polyangia bacterium]|nr:type 1 glutamine amidotransferase domain-containing protein [Polyangia bacterium]